MRWVAPSEKDEANYALEKRLWRAADQLSLAAHGLVRAVRRGDEVGRLDVAL